MADNITERVDDPSAAGVQYYVGLEHLDPESLKIRRWGTPDDVEATKLRFQPGDIIFGRRRAYQRKLAVADFEGICSAHALVLRAREDTVAKEFLPFFMQSDAFFERALTISVGSLSPTINWKTLAQQEFAIPPLDEQRRIADILWAADEAIEKTNDCLDAHVGLSKSLLSKVFCSEADVAEIALGNVGTWLSGGTPSRAREDFWRGDIPWVSPKDMKADVLQRTIESISVEGAESGSRVIPKGTILIVVRGMILAHTFPVAITARSMAFNQDIKALVTSQDFLPEFVFYWLRYKSYTILRSVSDSSHGTKRITSESIFNMMVPCKSRAEQEELVDILQHYDATHDDLQIHKLRLVEVKRSLLQRLLIVTEAGE
jgi:type I restriction enzyme S subunit